MLVELGLSELRYRAVLEVLAGATVIEVARRYGVSRQTVHVWLVRYAADGGVVNLDDRSSRPHGCPHQMPAVLEAKLLEVRDRNPMWGPVGSRWLGGDGGAVTTGGGSGVGRWSCGRWTWSAGSTWPTGSRSSA
jgi:hypothetical protein